MAAPDPLLLTVAAVAGIASVLATMVLTRAAPRLGLQRQDEHPRVGGLAIAAALAIVAVAIPEVRAPVVLLPAAAALLLGLHDDLSDSPAAVRLLALIGIAAATWAAGARIDAVLLPGLSTPVALGGWSAPVTVATTVVIVVGFDFIDGLDGLASSLGLLATVGLALLGAPPALCVAVVAALAVFVFGANRPPASSWLGDAGSNALGMLLATLAVTLPGPLPALPVALLFAVPVLDSVLTVARRVRSSEGLLAGELGHLHHRLLRLWGDPAHALAELLGVAALCTAAGLLATDPDRQGQAIFGALMALGLLLWRTGWISRGGPGTR